MFREVVIASAVRTPIGAFLGSLSTVPAPKLGALVIEEALKRANVDKNLVNQVIMGCVLPAGVGQAPARQAAIYAGLPHSVEAYTVNKVCGSGLFAVMQAANLIALGEAEIIVAGGMENMSLAPYYSNYRQSGYRMGNVQLIDGMVLDGLTDPYSGKHMGLIGEMCAAEMGITREMQDEYAVKSYYRAAGAQNNGLFKPEIIGVTIPQRKGDPKVVEADEEPGRITTLDFKKMTPAFQKDGTITAGNASKINDGAAAVVVMSAEKARELGIEPMAVIRDYASHSQLPEQFPIAPTGAIKKVLDRTDLTTRDIDFWEINEAFSVVALANNRLLELDGKNVNVRGGAVALGHPIGASGARILTTLLHTMKGGDLGCASLCIGGGEAVAMIVEK
ncbi:MAG: acetyl-CoA C-acyltransferase [Candidatus Kerfeldbacteria bacterium CG_4_10_14_0_8_um_filter_42_10]|uniref:Acetyl-CoA C-acyltransferase n=1 Tax=Candidatus Kerfeldbacteria bacterium CG_4_10_14_0_8_um_filter_42_10 TaxID=2014248 RepID=A0A2M7RJR1_9BACT|nr:MAG: acetyl-CoA C-acyltransferase [Candidatus Kerfeldbacteria bacterium CG_4_10_14_0_8_um_filter_42_10]